MLSTATIDQALLSDTQTSGGLLVACDAASVDAVLAIFTRHGFAAATVVGEVGAALAKDAGQAADGPARLVVR